MKGVIFVNWKPFTSLLVARLHKVLPGGVVAHVLEGKNRQKTLEKGDQLRLNKRLRNFLVELRLQNQYAKYRVAGLIV